MLRHNVLARHFAPSFRSLILLFAVVTGTACGGGDNLTLSPLVSTPENAHNRLAGRKRNSGTEVPLADWVGVIGTGQSLSVGAAAQVPVSTTQLFHNLKLLDEGPDPKYPLDGGGILSLIPLTEPIRPHLAGYRMASELGKTFATGAVILTHGECDAADPAYEAGLHQLAVDYNQDLRAITGQTRDIPLLVSQQSTVVRPRGGSAIAVWRLGVDYPGEAFCVGPKYQYQYASDHLHMDAAGYRRLGEKYAEVYDHVVNKRRFWAPVQPNRFVRDGARITVYFDVPTPPLNWDENISAPHQEVHTAWAQGRGFEVSDESGELTIASVEIVADNIVEITLTCAPSGEVLVRYALTQDGTGYQGGTDLGMRGQLRDSNALVAYDIETITVQVSSGSPTVTSPVTNAFLGRTGHDLVEGAEVPDGTIVESKDSGQRLTLSNPWPGATGTADLTFHHDLHNYCVQFEQVVTGAAGTGS